MSLRLNLTRKGKELQHNHAGFDAGFLEIECERRRPRKVVVEKADSVANIAHRGQGKVHGRLFLLKELAAPRRLCQSTGPTRLPRRPHTLMTSVANRSPRLPRCQFSGLSSTSKCMSDSVLNVMKPGTSMANRWRDSSSALSAICCSKSSQEP